MPSPPYLDLLPFSRAGGVVCPPGSKSISNRVLLLAALSEGTTEIHNLLDSDDTRVMLDALRHLGCAVETTKHLALRITGLGQTAPQTPADLFLGNAGTAMRPLTAALALLAAQWGGQFTLSGVARMHERPIGDLVDALVQLGCRVDYEGKEGYPPLRIAQGMAMSALRLDTPVRVRGDVSSQFLTALLMALPLAARERQIIVEVDGELISKPYIHITLQLLAQFGITVQHDAHMQRFCIPAGSRYQSPGRFSVEADASSASYFVALGAIAEGNGITIQGVGQNSMQGDIRFVQAAQAMGAQVQAGPDWLRITRGAWPLQAVDLDCNHIPDAAMTLAVMALYANGTTTLHNIGSWRVKETDRITAMASELRKLGAQVEEGPDWLRITPPATPADWRAASLHTYDDHRMAMCLSLAAFNPAGLTLRIEDPGCVAKTYPQYFPHLFHLVQIDDEAIPVICIDGPSASGKGTLALAVARRLGWHYLDSGALYRLAAVAAQRNNIAIEEANAQAIVDIFNMLPISFDDGRVYLDEDVTDLLRTEEAGLAASRIAAMPTVRRELLEKQRDFCVLPGLVTDGRDMGTVVFPHAPLKIFLTASVQCRAQRRYEQLISQGIAANIDSLCVDLQARDARDTSRAAAPLQAAPDALLLDNTAMTIDETVEQVLRWWQDRLP